MFDPPYPTSMLLWRYYPRQKIPCKTTTKKMFFSQKVPIVISAIASVYAKIIIFFDSCYPTRVYHATFSSSFFQYDMSLSEVTYFKQGMRFGSIIQDMVIEVNKTRLNSAAIFRAFLRGSLKLNFGPSATRISNPCSKGDKMPQSVR